MWEEVTAAEVTAAQYWVMWMTPIGLAWWRFSRLGLQKIWSQ
jgi:hypothetical protein